MHPKAHEFFPCHALALGDLRLVVREYVVLTAAVDVEFGPENTSRHGAALDVPTRTAATPWTFPAHIAICFVPCLPECEVADIFLFVFVVANPNTVAEFLGIEVCELTVVGERADAEIHGAILGAVGVAFFDER